VTLNLLWTDTLSCLHARAILLRPPPGGGGCEELRPGCPSICLWVGLCLSRRSRISNTTYLNFTKFSVRVKHGRGSVIRRRQCNMLCTSGSVDDVIFSHNGPNTQAWSLQCSELSVVTRQMAPLNCAPGAKSAVADCLVC